MAKRYAPNDLRSIPGVGEDLQKHLRDLGIATVDDLKGRDPEALYEEDCLQNGCRLDRCVLYVYRLAVYYAGHETHEPEKLKWWNWKD